MSDRRIAEKVIIDLRDQSVTIDGETFPYWLDNEGPQVTLSGGHRPLPIVHLPVMAGDLEIIPANREPEKS